MDQPHAHDDPDDDLEDLELGTPVYEGTGLSVRALTADELERFLQAHAGQPGRLLGSGWRGAADAASSSTEVPLWGSPDPTGPAAPGWQPSLPTRTRLAPRGGYGSPGRSALQQYRRERAAELAGWARSAGWRAMGVVAAGLLAGLLVQAAGLGRLALPAGLAPGLRGARAPGGRGPPPACFAACTVGGTPSPTTLAPPAPPPPPIIW